MTGPLGAGPGPRVDQVLATLGYGDAIAHEALGIRRALCTAGYVSDIFVETADPRVASMTRSYRRMPALIGPDDILIHHFSIGSRASRTSFALPARMVLVYHNITPPEYFVGVNKALVGQCFHGRRELTAYVERCELALGDSEYNRAELDAVGFAPTGVLPVVPDFSHLEVPPDRRLASHFDDDWTNILFVGRVIPSKRFDDLIRVFHAYRTLFNPRSRLLLVGAHSGFEQYLAQLYHLTGTLGTPDVHLVGQVSDEELTAFYDVADVFLCASEHEGFCVPIVEAFYKGVPVVARAAAAVPSTMDGAGVLYDARDPRDVAALVHALVDDPDLHDRVVAGQDAALDRLRGRPFDRTIVGFVEGVRAAPRRPLPPVAFDFWRQFEAFERLKALRRHRPSAFHALPDPTRRTRRGEAGE